MHYLKRGAAPRPLAPPPRRIHLPLAPLPRAGGGAGGLPADADSGHGSFYPRVSKLSQMEKEATDMMRGVKLGPGSSHATSKSNRMPTHTREGDGKVDQEVGLVVALISPPGHTYTTGVLEEWSGLHRCNPSLRRCQPTTGAQNHSFLT